MTDYFENRILILGHAGTRQKEKASGEKWRQNQIGNDEASLHYS